MKTATITKALVSAFSGFVGYYLGGWDLLLQTLVSLVVLDFITGTAQAIYNGTFKSRISANGVIRKIFIGFTIVLAVVIQHITGDTMPIREITISFYIFSEGMSILENIGKVIEYPEKLKEIFAQFKGDEF